MYSFATELYWTTFDFFLTEHILLYYILGALGRIQWEKWLIVLKMSTATYLSGLPHDGTVFLWSYYAWTEAVLLHLFSTDYAIFSIIYTFIHCCQTARNGVGVIKEWNYSRYCTTAYSCLLRHQAL